MARNAGWVLVLGALLWPRWAAASTDTTAASDDAGGTGGSSTGASPQEPFHESTMGTPLYEGPAVNDPPIRVELDDDGFCRVAKFPGDGAWVLLMLLAMGLRRGRWAVACVPLLYAPRDGGGQFSG